MSEEPADPVVDHQASDLSANRRGFLSSALAMGGATVGLGAGASAAGAEMGKGDALMNPRLFSFIGGSKGEWSVISSKTIVGAPLPAVERLDVVMGAVDMDREGAKWILRGVTSNARYTTRPEKDSLVRKQAPLGRPESNFAALIPIRKNAKWWELTQDERREIFEEKSQHTTIGLKYLPGVARRLHHCRDLSEAEPFDFLTLFDYSKEDAAAFDDLVAALRATAEWTFVDREVDIRLVRVT